MQKPWENDSCEHVKSYYTLYSVPIAAALWCGIPQVEIQEHLDASAQVKRAVFRHPYIACLEPRCRAIHDAIEKGLLLVSREDGKSINGTAEHVAPERRHVSRQHLKEWIGREFPADKPAFLFDEIERNMHPATNLDAFLSLTAESDSLRARLQEAEAWAKTSDSEREAMTAELDSLRALVAKELTVTERNTLLTIIAALCDYSAIKVGDRGAAAQLARLTDEIGAPVSDDTVRRWLKAIPDVLASRTK
jgi:hypothetical protein